MKKRSVMLVGLLEIVAIALPAFAADFKYGGLYRLRWQSSDNVVDGSNWFGDDNQNYLDQRLRMFFTVIASENLRVVTKWEVDTLWGNDFDKFSTGGGVSADSINLETKNVYVDFNIPATPVRSMLGVQPLTLLSGWILDDDFSAAKFSAKFDPIQVTVGYVATQNNDVTSERENIDDWFISLDYAEGPWRASLVGDLQAGHNTDVSTFFNPRMSSYTLSQGSSVGFFGAPTNSVVTSITDPVTLLPVDLANHNMLFDLGVAVGYKLGWVNAYLNFVKNFGSFDLFPNGIDRSIDYTGYMFEGGANFYYGSFTFKLGGFLASGDNFDANSESDGNFRYPRGASHYWAEVLGLGVLDQSVCNSYLAPVRTTPVSARTGDNLADPVKRPPGAFGYQAADVPSNLWTVNAGIAYQALEKTTLTLNYYYIGTQEEVLANVVTDKTSKAIGNELDFYVDQGLVDGLNLTIVAAYLFAGEGYTILPSRLEDDAWKAGMRLQWAF